ncbi:MAG: hypothetical protein AAF692_08410 [Pseudomonadota bacterium]
MAGARSKHPYTDPPRRYVAYAMPQGDRMFGVPGPLVMIQDFQGDCARHRRFYSPEEAINLRDELSVAIEALELPEQLLRESGSPRAATGPCPFKDHRTQAEVGGEE